MSKLMILTKSFCSKKDNRSQNKMRYYITLKTTVVTTAAQFVSDGKWILEQWVEFSMMVINLDINMFFY